MAALPCCAEEDVEAGSAALRVDWPVYPRRAEHNTSPREGIEDGPRLRNRCHQSNTSRGRGSKCYKIALGPLSMPEVATVLRGLPRICAALGFGAAGTALSMVWWLIIFHARGVTPFVLFIDAPGISAAVCGWALRQAVPRSRPSLPGQLLFGARASARWRWCDLPPIFWTRESWKILV